MCEEMVFKIEDKDLREVWNTINSRRNALLAEIDALQDFLNVIDKRDKEKYEKTNTKQNKER